MIGQKQLCRRVSKLIEDGTFPRFSILVGPKGSGKKTFANWIYQQFGVGVLINIGTSVDAIRQCIAQSYTISGTQVINLIADADNMSNAAKNALLKITEEPPNNAFFIMTLEDENNTLETIRSRGTIFHTDRYTPDEILQFAIDRFRNELQDQKSRDIVRELCDTPGEVVTLYKSNILEFYDYVQLVVDNIAEVSLANAFKIPNKVALKEDADGYNLRLFWKAVASVMLERAKQRGNSKELVKYCDGYSITSKYLQKLKVKGINRQMLMDNWVLELRDSWI